MSNSKQTHPTTTPVTYRDAGVNIEAGNDLVERIKPIARSTSRPEVVTGLGGFSGLCQIPAGYREPVLVSATDGVGTKLKLAMTLNRHDTIGIDLVAMCVNDLVVCGAEPLFFLDYYATGKLDVDLAESVVGGIGEGCRQAGCALVGGETAEMPGLYQGSDYDLAGFCVGVAEKSAIIDGSAVSEGDLLIGIRSSGPHSNGYSLIRKLLEQPGVDLNQPTGDCTLAEALLAPTRIYVKPLLTLKNKVSVHAMAHITGGGLTENIPRVLPEEFGALINANSWQHPEVFRTLQQLGTIETTEMLRTFNCGIGMVVVVAANDAKTAIDVLEQSGEQAAVIGQICANMEDRVVYSSSGTAPATDRAR